MRAAVVGAGVFGCTIAVELARAGHAVDLYERHPDILYGASRANQGRLHLGYHYPRSPETAAAARQAAGDFARRFPAAIVEGGRHYYAVAARGSKVDADEYLDFCDWLGQPYRVACPSMMYRSKVSTCVAVAEQYVDIRRLRSILRVELREAAVTLHCGAEVEPAEMSHDLVVAATYGRGWPGPLRYEVCETALVKLGQQFAGISVVVMDGPFCSLDPVPDTDLHMLYDVDRSVHASGLTPAVAAEYVGLVDQGRVYTSLTRVDEMALSARRFLDGIGMPSYQGSLFSLRAVLPDVDGTDERPTLVQRHGRVVHVLAGKIGTAVSAATSVLAEVQQPVPVA